MAAAADMVGPRLVTELLSDPNVATTYICATVAQSGFATLHGNLNPHPISRQR